MKEKKTDLAKDYTDLIGVYRSNFKTPFKNFDLYMLFLEKGIEWLQEEGKLGYICSNQFMTAFYGKKLREFIVNRSSIKHIVDFGESGVFDDVTNYPCIIILENSELANSIKCVKVKDSAQDILDRIRSNINSETYLNEFLSIFSISQESLTSQVWVLAPKKIMKVIDNLKKASFRLGDYCDFDSGIRTGRDPILVVKLIKDLGPDSCEILPSAYKKDPKYFPIEKGLLKPVLRGRDVRKWNISWSQLYLIFPHTVDKEGYVTILEDEIKERYPHGYDYLLMHKSSLESRKHYGKTSYELHGAWYAVMYPAKHAQQTILSPRLTNKANFSINDQGYHFLGGPGGIVSIIPKDVSIRNTIMGILNSRLFEFYLSNFTQIKAGKYYQFGIDHLKRFPIPNLESKDTNDKLIIKNIYSNVAKIILLNKQLSDCNEFIKTFYLTKEIDMTTIDDFPSIIFNISTNKVSEIRLAGTRIYFNFIDYIDCKDRVVANYVKIYLESIKNELLKEDDPRNIICNLKIPNDKKQITLLINQYDKAKKAIIKIPNEIKNIENKIDYNVYNLYKFSKEDVSMIERYRVSS